MEQKLGSISRTCSQSWSSKYEYVQAGWMVFQKKKQQLYGPGSINLLVDIVRFYNLNHHLYYIILHKNKAILTQVNSHIADSDKQ